MRAMQQQASWLVTGGIGGLAVLVASAFVLLYSLAVERLGGRRIVARMTARTGLLGWMAIFAALGSSGKLAQFDAKPPPLMMAMVFVMLVAAGLAFSKVGDTFVRGLPLSWLVLFQSFRLPLEWVMHRAALEGVMPVEMSYAGYNYDVLTGATAIGLGVMMLRGPVSLALVWAWNVLGSLLLLVIVGVAVAATPTFHAFGEEPEHVNTWIAHFPFVWLPSVLVAAAVFGHLVIFRVLRASSSPAPASPAPSSSPSTPS